jgi:hypothetical protein
MPRTRKKLSHQHPAVAPKPHRQQLFFLFLGASFLALLWYRTTQHFPVWFDEVIMKAVVFGLPVWLFMLISRTSFEQFGFNPRKFWSGAYLGLALGGMFGFIAMMASSLKHQHIFIPNLFSAGGFWTAFALAFATAWWESLFFYSFVFAALRTVIKGELELVLAATIIFIVFHAPILIVTNGFIAALPLLILLALFAAGQAILYLRYKNLASMVFSHAFWGMALMVYR